jgi:hypothetical protein
MPATARRTVARRRGRRLLLTGVLAMGALTAGPYPAHAQRTQDANGRIVFDDQDGPVYTVNSNGTGLRQIAFGHDVAHWSNAGNTISMSDEAPDGRITTALVNPDGSGFVSEPIPDATLNLECPAWAPRDRRISCEGWDDLRPERGAGIFTVRTSGWDDLARVTANPYGGHDIPGDYAPDGDRIVFIRENPGDDVAAVFVVDADGRAPRRITPWGLPECCTSSWSPDGRWIAFSGDGQLYLVHPNGSGLRPVRLAARGAVRAFQPAWSPDGKKIVFGLSFQSGPQDGLEGIYTAAADGSDVTPVVTTTTGFFDNPDWGRAQTRPGANLKELMGTPAPARR